MTIRQPIETMNLDRYGDTASVVEVSTSEPNGATRSRFA